MRTAESTALDAALRFTHDALDVDLSAGEQPGHVGQHAGFVLDKRRQHHLPVGGSCLLVFVGSWFRPATRWLGLVREDLGRPVRRS